MIWDPEINGTLTFIHLSSGDQLWSLKHSTWKRVTLKNLPGFKGTEMGMVYDTVNKEVLWFGNGCPFVSNASNGQFCIYTIYNGSWNRVTPTDAGPNASYPNLVLSNAVWDSKDNTTLFFGGYNYPSAVNQTWTFVNNTWTQISTTCAPTPRYGVEMTYTDGKVLLFGGMSTNNTPLADTWTYVSGVWTKVVPNQAPSAIQSTTTNTLAYDPVLGVTFLYGEPTSTHHGAPRNATWMFSAGSWTELSASVSPPGGSQANGHEVMAYDPQFQCVVMFVEETKGHNYTWLLS
jgi:hypothetical protein